MLNSDTSALDFMGTVGGCVALAVLCVFVSLMCFFIADWVRRWSESQDQEFNETYGSDRPICRTGRMHAFMSCDRRMY